LKIGPLASDSFKLTETDPLCLACKPWAEQLGIVENLHDGRTSVCDGLRASQTANVFVHSLCKYCSH